MTHALKYTQTHNESREEKEKAANAHTAASTVRSKLHLRHYTVLGARTFEFECLMIQVAFDFKLVSFLCGN